MCIESLIIAILFREGAFYYSAILNMCVSTVFYLFISEGLTRQVSQFQVNTLCVNIFSDVNIQ